MVARDVLRCSRRSRSAATSCSSVRCSSAAGRASTGARATRSRWPGWSRRACSRRPGAGGIALTAWAVRRSGMERRIVACRLVAFTTLLYAVYMLALVLVGLGLYLGILEGPAPFAITVVPAIFGAVVIVIFLSIALLPGDFERRIARWRQQRGRIGRLARKARRGARLPGQRRAHRAAPDARPRGRRARAPSRGGASTSRRCGRPSTRSAVSPALVGDRDELLRRHDRQHAADPRRDRRGRGRHDRRIRRASTSTPAWRWSPCSSTARSRSGCRPFPARSPTFSCAARSSAGGSRRSRARAARFPAGLARYYTK